MKDTIEALDAFIAVSLTRNEWDEMPMLMFVTEEQCTIVVLSGLDDVPAALPMVAEAITRGSFPVQRGNVTGVIFFCEGWKLKGEPGKQEELRAEVEALREMGRRYEDHPAAVESKIWTAVDAQSVIHRQFDRGSEGVEELDSEHLSGRVIDGLKMIFEAVSA